MNNYRSEIIKAIFRNGGHDPKSAKLLADDTRLDEIPQEQLYAVADEARDGQKGMKALLTIKEMVAAWKRLQANKQEELF